MIDPGYQAALDDLFRSYSRGDFEGFLRLLTPDVQFRGPLSGEHSQGHKTVQTLLFTARERLRMRTLQAGATFQTQNQVAVDFIGSAEAPDGKTLTLTGIFVLEFAPDGLVQDIRFFWDPKPLLPHLGT